MKLSLKLAPLGNQSDAKAHFNLIELNFKRTNYFFFEWVQSQILNQSIYFWYIQTSIVETEFEIGAIGQPMRCETRPMISFSTNRQFDPMRLIFQNHSDYYYYYYYELVAFIEWRNLNSDFVCWESRAPRVSILLKSRFTLHWGK